MTREEELQLMAQVMALEYLVKHLLWIQAVRVADEQGGDEQTAARELEQFVENSAADLERSTVKTTDPAISDHLTALVSEHVRRIVDALVKEMLASD
jgi:hypothetical protein